MTAPIHILLAIGALIPIAGDLFRNRDKIAASCLLVPYAGYALFCLLLSWQIWGSRLQVPLFCLAGPVVAYAVGKNFPRLMAVCIALAVALALFSAVTNKSKPLVGKRFFLLRPTRARTRYYPNGEDVRPGLSALRVLCREREPKSVGIFARWNRFEYLVLWNLLYGDFPEPTLVKLNATRGKAPSALPSPDLVVGWFADPGETNAVFREKFVLVTNAGPVQIYSSRGNAEAFRRER